MKNVMNNSKKVFLMVALFATVMGYASDNSFYISKGDANKTVITLNDVKEGNLFTIKDKNGLILYKEAIQQNGLYKKGFDLTSLPDGSYFFELDKDMEIKTIPFKVKVSEVVFDKDNAETIFKPSTVVKQDLLFVSKLALEGEELEISIYQENGFYAAPYQLIHNETISNTKHIERVYKFVDFRKGEYKIIYKTEGKTFVEFI
ncbi:hypothetical protein EYD45_15610 [Hyunsoonleella flava]|uniref:T9SS C-terminal target domain-containing protein n=1 Tax=Hyunsoonleella flava TaxID=2527939 RepID=A0A4Q9FFH6_9FLAO|nr:hypothetical protein [Hyunsoonleella flava]TBM99384.1 hypothetical protein EYD45_15610 [Hyunsoonleella flava]